MLKLKECENICIIKMFGSIKIPSVLHKSDALNRWLKCWMDGLDGWRCIMIISWGRAAVMQLELETKVREVFIITKKAPTRAFSLLKVTNSPGVQIRWSNS